MYPLPIVALLTPGIASNAPEDIADNADCAFPAEGMMNDDPGCYSDDDMGPGGGFPQSLASPAKKSTTEVDMHSVQITPAECDTVVYCMIIQDLA